MYYRDEKGKIVERFNSIEGFGHGSDKKFPMWLMIIIITLIVIIGLFLLFVMRSKRNQTQKFGYKFY
jgi:lipoprotein signal peptidase